MKTTIGIIGALIIIVTTFLGGYQIGQMKSLFEGFGESKVTKVNVDSVPNLREDYNDFIYKFISDSLFQLDRIKFPLMSQQWDSDEVDSTRIEKSNWKTVRLFWGEEYKPQIYDNFNREMRDTDERLFCWEGIENGINVEYRFRRIKGLWYLTEFNDFSD